MLPTKQQVMERILHLKNFPTGKAANNIVEEIHDRWVWCNVYPIHQYTISKKVYSLVASFSALDRWTKSKRDKLAVVGTDETALMTGKYNGCIRS